MGRRESNQTKQTLFVAKQAGLNIALSEPQGRFSCVEAQFVIIYN